MHGCAEAVVMPALLRFKPAALAVVSPESEESYSDESKELAPHWSTPL